MKRTRHFAHRLFAVFLFSATLAMAQEPGTNMATPPPATTVEPALSATSPGATSDPSMASRAPQATIAQEPVIDPETTKSTLPNRPLLITGIVLLGGAYGAAAVVAATSERDEDEKLFYPVVGPWMDLDERDCSVRKCSNADLNKGLLIGDGIVQGVGALSILFSLFIPEKTTRRWYLIGSNDFTIAPRLSSGMTGLSAVGRF